MWHEYEIVFGRRKFATQVSECGSSLFSECNETGNSLMSIQGMDGNMKSTLEDLDVSIIMAKKFDKPFFFFRFDVFGKFLVY